MRPAERPLVRLRYSVRCMNAAAMLAFSMFGLQALAGDTPNMNDGPTAADPIDFTRFDIYASTGFVLTHQYVTDTGNTVATIDTTKPSITRERQDDDTVTVYETLESARGQITLEQVTKFDADGQCQTAFKTRYQWLSVFPEVAHKGDQLQRLASVTDFDYERPCGTVDTQQPEIESVIKVAYTVVGRSEYLNGSVRLDDCVKLTEQAPDYSGIATLCAGVGTAYRLRTGSTFGRNERKLIAVEQPSALSD